MGYESNEASVVTNVTSDHLDLQGIHTLPELAEVKSTVARVDEARRLGVLNADDPLVAAIAAPGPGARRAVLARRRAARRARPAARGGAGEARGYVVRDGGVHRPRLDGEPVEHRIIEVGRVPITLGGARPPQRRERPRRGGRRPRARA